MIIVIVERLLQTMLMKKTKGVSDLDTPGGKQQVILINESGLYSLILSSKLPKAKEFKRWVTSEVLPSIRKHGAYMTDETLHRAITERVKYNCHTRSRFISAMTKL